jgi:GH25 family lysozyme M1 (1,4-beta-N-acetylmuramidase)
VAKRRRRRRRIDKGVILVIVLAAVLAVAILFGALKLLFGVMQPEKSEKEQPVAVIENEEPDEIETLKENKEEQPEDAQDPQSELNTVDTEDGAETEIAKILTAENAQETSDTTIGIDVAKYQGTIDWAEVAASGIDFAMVRVGYRTQNSGEIKAGTNAKYNMQEATAKGLKVGAYFFSTAISEEEAIEEARWVADYISQYQITYPVAYNCEGFLNPENRQYPLTKTERTDFAIAFLNEIYEQGYTPMFYASKAELTADADWETSRIEKSFKIWVSQYPTIPYPDTMISTYTGPHDMWQFTNMGNVAGIKEPVDVNVAYFGYSSSVEAQNQEAPEQVEADVEALMDFVEVDETVTSKEVTNLRDIPSQGADSKILAQLRNGETAKRTGMSGSGWSRLEIDGQKYYAVSNYLTTDLSYKTPSANAEPDDGIETEFTKVSEQVTPKIEVNLRKLPSVTREDATVVATVRAGEVFTRTGINTDQGWSRVEYNGQTLYCVSSYLNVVQ